MRAARETALLTSSYTADRRTNQATAFEEEH
jgi:hypothetical protein